MPSLQATLRHFTRLRGARVFILLLLNEFLVSFVLLNFQQLPKQLDSPRLPTIGQSNGVVVSTKEALVAEWRQKPRMLQLVSSEQGGQQQGIRPATNRTIPSLRKEAPQYGMPRPLCEPGDDDCVIPGTWQETNNMACNLVHEIDLNDFLGRKEEEGGNRTEHLRIVAKGGKRFVWKFLEFDGTSRALKMFKYRANRKEDFSPMTIELQRRDALIHEVTSSSPYVVNMYGYCAVSAIYDFGDGGQLEANVKKDGPPHRNELLRISHRIAASVADVHHPDESGMPTIAHSDIHGEQWIMVNGEYQLTDFNLAKLLRRSLRTNTTVPFRRDVVDNWFSPEVHRQQYSTENIGTEKMDIWNMGNIFYLIFVGHPPFDGLSRSLGHSLILEEHMRPEIPKEKRESQDYVDRTMVKVIDMCMKENPEERATARQVADFLEASVNPGSYATIEERNERSTRFPSIEERVKRYMSSWYTPPCKDDPTATAQYQVLSKEGSPWRKVLVRKLAIGSDNNPEWDHVVEIDSEIVSDEIMMIEPGMLNDTDRPHAGYRADVIQTVLPLMDSLEGKPLLMQWGDRVSLHLSNSPHSSLAIPHLKKCRPALAVGELERITAARCYGADRPRSNSIRDEQVQEPIIWKLDSHRLQDPIKDVAEADKPWSEKQAKAVFRAKLTGHAFVHGHQMDTNRAKNLLRGNMTDQEYCYAIERCRFVLKHHKSSLVDARLTDLLGKPLNPTISGIDVLGEKMAMQDLLDYKVLIMLEGNDVSSGLRWALRSNSLVMMPPPTFTSWVMEELLEPWVHFIPLDPSFNDTEEKMQWVLDHDKEAERISYQGSLWIKDLLQHPDAEKENIEINKRILERYQRLFVRSDELVSDRKSQIIDEHFGPYNH